jgi:Zn-dependent protease
VLEILRDDPVVFVLLALALVEAIAMHEFAHALAADLQGDRLPRASGRLTLNPLKHLDPLGTILLLVAGFGWGKPVEFRPEALSSRQFGAAIVALAGPLMNLALAFVAVLVTVALDVRDDLSTFATFLRIFFGINLLLAVFNLLPLPPLDGSRLLTIFLPPGRQKIVFWLDQYGFFVLIALVFLTGLSFLTPILDAIARFLFSIAGG